MACVRMLAVVLVGMTLFLIRPVSAALSLDETLRPYLATYELPAIAAAVVKNGKVLASGAVGTRRVGTRIPVGVNDRFHLGSDTKAMTSLLGAMLVEDGKLRWSSTFGEVFPELGDKAVPGLRGATLEQFLSHTSGLPSDNEAFGALLGQAAFQEGNLDELRAWFVQQWSSTQMLASTPGTTFAYSNAGYTIAGAMMERVTGKTWDELVVERIFTPLGLASAGLGPQMRLGRVDAPLGHVVVSGKTKAMLGGPDADNPPLIGPAGLAHMSVLDFAKWAGWNAGQGKRGPRLVRPETVKKLHTSVVGMPEMTAAAPGTPTRGRYGLGWGELTVDWAPSPLLYHGGSNQKNLAHIWVDPPRDFAMVVVTNIATPAANDALFALAPALYKRYAK